MKITLLISKYADPLVEQFIKQNNPTHVYDGMEATNKAIDCFVGDDEDKVVFFHQRLYLKNEILECLNMDRFDERNINNIVDTMKEGDHLIIYNVFHTNTFKNLKQEHPEMKVIVCYDEKIDVSKVGIEVDNYIK